MSRLAIALAAAMATPCLAAEPITGRASVIDGDMIEIAGARTRFHGIDAPESWRACRDVAHKEYRCGQVSAEALDAFLGQHG